MNTTSSSANPRLPVREARHKKSTPSERADPKLDSLAKILFILTVCLSFVLTTLKGLQGGGFRVSRVVGTYTGLEFRFILLFSYIIPISLRVSQSRFGGKLTVYAYQIENGK